MTTKQERAMDRMTIAEGVEDHHDVRAGRRVLELEAQALEKLAGQLDQSFVDAVDVLFAIKGRVVVTGMGKSGHVARKIAASLASTGTPALYVHPGEASHGDLGMIQHEDAILCLSNSGETPELSDLVDYSRRFAIPLIAMVGRAQSSLSDAADVALVLPETVEACPMGLAPTTSTTLMMGLGDALAIALLERRGFSSDEYRVFHPGGQLGAKLIKVENIMHVGEQMPLIGADTPMSEALIEMTRKSFGCVGIADDAGRLIGIITDGDLRRHMDDGLLQHRAGDVMTHRPKTIRPAALVAEAIGYMNANNISALFVTRDDKPVGIIQMHDCLRAGVR